MKLFVANIPFDTTDAQLLALFEPHGDVVSAKTIYDRETNRPKGYGFVEMRNAEDGEAAIRELNGSQLGNPPRAIRVEEARERPRYKSHGDSRPRNHGGKSRGDRRGRW